MKYTDQIHGTPAGPRVPKYRYVYNKRRIVNAVAIASLMIMVMLYFVFELNILDDTRHVEGEITAKFDNQNSTVYRTAWLEVNGDRWDAWGIIDDYEVGDHLDAHLEPWCDPLVHCDMTDLVVMGFFLAVIMGTLGTCVHRDKIEVGEWKR